MNRYFHNYINTLTLQQKVLTISLYALGFLAIALIKWLMSDEDSFWFKWATVGLMALSFARDLWRMNSKSLVELELTEAGIRYSNPARFQSRDLKWANIKWMQIEPLAIHFFSQSSFRNSVFLKDFNTADIEIIITAVKQVAEKHQIKLVDKTGKEIRSLNDKS